jgi:hypothetical protein
MDYDLVAILSLGASIITIRVLGKSNKKTEKAYS